MPSSSYLFLWTFLAYGLLTAFWSENFQLIIIKLALFSCVALAFAFGGSLLPDLCPELNPYAALAPVFLAVVFGSIVGATSETAIMQGNFHGITGNANMLAASLFFTSPWLFVSSVAGGIRRSCECSCLSLEASRCCSSF